MPTVARGRGATLAGGEQAAGEIEELLERPRHAVAFEGASQARVDRPRHRRVQRDDGGDGYAQRVGQVVGPQDPVGFGDDDQPVGTPRAVRQGLHRRVEREIARPQDHDQRRVRVCVVASAAVVDDDGCVRWPLESGQRRRCIDGGGFFFPVGNRQQGRHGVAVVRSKGHWRAEP